MRQTNKGNLFFNTVFFFNEGEKVCEEKKAGFEKLIFGDFFLKLYFGHY